MYGGRWHTHALAHLNLYDGDMYDFSGGRSACVWSTCLLQGLSEDSKSRRQTTNVLTYSCDLRPGADLCRCLVLNILAVYSL